MVDRKTKPAQEDEQGEDSAAADPAETSHPAGEQQAADNRDNESPG